MPFSNSRASWAASARGPRPPPSSPDLLASLPVAPDDPAARRTIQRRRGGQQAGDPGRFDASAVERTLRPVTREDKVVVATRPRSHPVLRGAGQREHVALRRVDVRPPELTVEATRPGAALVIDEQLPSKLRRVPAHPPRPKGRHLVAHERERTRFHLIRGPSG